MMKKTSFQVKVSLLVAALTLWGQMAEAQSNDSLQTRRHQEGMPRHRQRMFTVADANQLMTTQLGLDEKQQKKVEKLNKQYASVIEGEKPKRRSGTPDNGQGGQRGMSRGGHGGRGGGFGGGDMGEGPGGGGFGGGPQGGMGHGPGGQGRPQGMPSGSTSAEDLDAQQAKYDKKLRKILSADQYKGYLDIKPKFYAQRKNREFLMGDQPPMEQKSADDATK